MTLEEFTDAVVKHFPDGWRVRVSGEDEGDFTAEAHKGKAHVVIEWDEGIGLSYAYYTEDKYKGGEYGKDISVLPKELADYIQQA